MMTTKSVLKGLLISVLLVTALPALSFAQTDVVEEERDNSLETQLLLNLPDETDNPNHTMIFADPSGEGIYIKIDGTSELRIQSPYILPSLGVGDHKLEIRFTDKQGATQILEKYLVVIPRPPVIKAPDTRTTSEISFTGTALANAKISILLTGESETYSADVESDEDGIWSTSFTEEFTEGSYTLVAFTRKNGYSSTFSETLTFRVEIDGTQITDPGAGEKQTEFTFTLESLFSGDILQNIQNNPDIALMSAVLVFAGWIISIILNGLFGKGRENRKETEFLKQLNGDKTPTESKKKSKKPKRRFKGKNRKVKTFKKMLGENKSSIKDKLQERNKKQEEAKDESEDKKKDKSADKPDSSNKDSKKDNKNEKSEKQNDKQDKKDSNKDGKSGKDKPKEDTKDTKDNSPEKASKPDQDKKEDKPKDKKKDPKSEDKKEISKEEFLKDFKDFDPDNDKGKEKQLDTKSLKDKKRNIKITLTSDNFEK